MELRTLIAASVLGCLLISCVSARSANQNALGDVSTFYTNTEYEYTKWLQMLSRTDVVFQLKGCSDGHIALSYYKDNHTVDVTEIVLAGWSNTLSAIRNGTIEDKEHYMQTYTPDLLHCAEYRYFWISWRHGMLRVGRGPTVGEQTFMQLDRIEGSPFWHMIRWVGFSTGYGHSGAWKLDENEGYHLYVHVPNDYAYNFMWKTTTAKGFPGTRFRVKACHDVHINLSPVEGKVHYEIVLGGWENKALSAIRLGWERKVEIVDADILSCEEFRYFTVLWADGIIRVGKGEVLAEGFFLEWRDPAFNGINHISFAAGYGSDATYVFEEDLENRFAMLSTPSNATMPSYDMFVETPRQDYMTFRVRSCSDVYLGLSMSPGSVNDMTQHVYLGTKGNTRSGVYNGFTTTPTVEVDTPDILSCDNTREFWMSWRNNHVELGSGLIWGIDKVMEFDIPGELRYVNSIGLANTVGQQALWIVRRDAGDNIFLRTKQVPNYSHLWVTTFQDFFTTFRLRSCRNSHILLGSLDGYFAGEQYEIILGEDSYKTTIKNLADGGSLLTSVETPEITHCSDFRTFWVGWLDGYIRIGKGHKYGFREIASLREAIPIRVNALAIATDGVTGSWEFESDRGDFFEGKSPDPEVSEKWFSIYSWHKWMYFQVSGAGGCIVLSPTYRDAKQSYKICMGLSGNTQIVLYKDETELQRITRPEILDLLDARDYWVSWEDGMLAMGSGKYRGTELLLEYVDDSPYEVRGAALTGLLGFSAEWRIWEYHSYEISYDTSIYKSFGQLWLSARHRSHLTFALQTCGRAEILLSAIMHNEENDYTYTLVLGDQYGMSSIWEGIKMKKFIEVPTPDLISCTEERYYWLSFYKGHIVLGTGREHGKNAVIAHQDLNGLDIRALSFTTVDYAGSWRFPLGNYVEGLADLSIPGLAGGEIAGIVIGAIVILLVFGLVAIIIIRPPERLTPFLTGAPATGTNGRHIDTPSTRSFENPMAEIDLVESGK